jgi:hypothetical protein
VQLILHTTHVSYLQSQASGNVEVGQLHSNIFETESGLTQSQTLHANTDEHTGEQSVGSRVRGSTRGHYLSTMRDVCTYRCEYGKRSRCTGISTGLPSASWTYSRRGIGTGMHMVGKHTNTRNCERGMPVMQHEAHSTTERSPQNKNKREFTFSSYRHLATVQSTATLQLFQIELISLAKGVRTIGRWQVSVCARWLRWNTAVEKQRSLHPWAQAHRNSNQSLPLLTSPLVFVVEVLIVERVHHFNLSRVLER